MDTLADLASMQHQQVVRVNTSNSGNSRKTDEVERHTSSSSRPLPSLSRPSSYTGSSLDINLSEPFKFYNVLNYVENSGVSWDVEGAKAAANELANNPSSYESYVRLVKALHQGLKVHVDRVDLKITESSEKPQSFTLTEELQQARQSMSARFSLSEDLWADWIDDQQQLAVTLEDCLEVVEICQRAVSEEVGSVKLWQVYGNWFLQLFCATHDSPLQDVTEFLMGKIQAWSDEDRMVATEVFSKTQLLNLWTQAVAATRRRINDGHLIWDIYIDIRMEELDASPSEDGIQFNRSEFMTRLHEPHATWDDTFEKFSSFVSRFGHEAYEETMVTVKQSTIDARKRYSVRENHESRLQRAYDHGSTTEEWTAFTEYIEWELGLSRELKFFSFDLLDSLYQRATLRLPSEATLWDDYLTFLVDENLQHQQSAPVLQTFDRACRHCPWSGSLWSQYIQFAEKKQLSHEIIEQVKHRATSTGLLDAGGLEEILKVHTAWCGYLRRQAFYPGSNDEDVDVAEVGIRSAIEDMETLGRKKYGKSYQGDPKYRLERLYIKFLSQCRNWKSARHTWKSLIHRRGNSHEFWLAFAEWEMTLWAFNVKDDQPLTSTPTEATAVLKQSLHRKDIDWPEKMIQSYLYHCEDHGTIEELQFAIVETKKASRLLTKRRYEEAARMQDVATTSSHPEVNGKRKRPRHEHDGDGLEHQSTKKSRADEQVSQTDATDHGSPMQVDPSTEKLASKRDRENTTVIVRNLPSNVTNLRVRQYFRDVS